MQFSRRKIAVSEVRLSDLDSYQWWLIASVIFKTGNVRFGRQTPASRASTSFSGTSRERQGLDAVGVSPKSIHCRHWRRSCRQCLSALAGHCIDDDYAKELVIVVRLVVSSDFDRSTRATKFKMAAGPSGKHSFDLQPGRIQQVDKQA